MNNCVALHHPSRSSGQHIIPFSSRVPHVHLQFLVSQLVVTLKCYYSNDSVILCRCEFARVKDGLIERREEGFVLAEVTAALKESGVFWSSSSAGHHLHASPKPPSISSHVRRGAGVCS